METLTDEQILNFSLENPQERFLDKRDEDYRIGKMHIHLLGIALRGQELALAQREKARQEQIIGNSLAAIFSGNENMRRGVTDGLHRQRELEALIKREDNTKPISQLIEEKILGIQLIVALTEPAQ